jgi:VWFA-related protein
MNLHCQSPFLMVTFPLIGLEVKYKDVGPLLASILFCRRKLALIISRWKDRTMERSWRWSKLTIKRRCGMQNTPWLKGYCKKELSMAVFFLRWVFLAVTLSSVVLSCVAQETKPDVTVTGPTALHVTSRLVVLDVVVTDKAGQMHNDLKQEDFQVTEDGVPQKLLSFEPPASHALPKGPPIQSTADLEKQAPQAPVTVVVLDELNTKFQDMAYARYALKKYLNAQPGSLQAPTMLIAISLSRLQVLKDYTQDRAAILTALDQHLTSYPWQLQAGVSTIRQLAQSLGALEQVAEATAGHPGHKNLLWVGHGFPSIDISNPNLDSNTAAGITTAIQQAVNMLRDSRITLYTIDPTALSSEVATRFSDSTPSGEINGGVGPDPFAAGVQFTSLASATGGKAFYSRNDVDAEIGESARDGVNYYTISYRPTGDSDAAQPYRKIHIEFTQPGLRAGYRDGYYTRNEARPTADTNRTVYDVDAAAESTLVYTGLTVTAVAKPNSEGEYLVGVPQSELHWAEEGGNQVAKLALTAVAVDNKNHILRRVTNELTARRPIANVDSSATGKLVRLEIGVPQAPGIVRIRFVVRGEADGRIGTADLRLPDAPPDAKPKR